MKKHPLTRRFISSDEAVPTKQQHIKPCADCPFARAAIPGWLGGRKSVNEQIDYWLVLAHGEAMERCHCTTNQECAGLAIFRANVCKIPKFALRLESDTKVVFESDVEFRNHHNKAKF
jgi:hypothetical protein